MIKSTQSISFKSKIPVKICQVTDNHSIVASISAAKKAEFDKMILGLPLFEGEKYNSKEQINININAMDYIRELAKRFNLQVKIACVTNIEKANDLIKYAKEIGTFDIFQIHTRMPLSNIQKVKNAFPESKILAKVPMGNCELSESLSKSRSYAKDESVTGVLLDSAIPSSGTLIDWNDAKIIIDNIHQHELKPVGLAGGISPKNAEEALSKTGADSLDANSGFRYSSEEWLGNQPIPKNPFKILSVLDIAKKHNTNFEL